MHRKTRQILRIAATSMAVLATGCIPVRTTNLEGSGRIAIRNADDKAELYRRFGSPDAQTTDGRFSLYSLTKEAEWSLITPQGAGEVTTNEVGTTHVLFTFDSANLTSDTHFNHCDDDSFTLLCTSDASDILFELIGEAHGIVIADQQRVLEPVHAALAASTHAAAVAGDVQALDDLIARGASPSSQLAELTPLHRAAQAGQIDVIEYLINAGMPIEVRSSRTAARPLHLAASAGQTDAIEWLLAHDADLEAEQADDTTPLRSALLFGHSEAAMHLIAAGANVNAKPGDLIILATQIADRTLVETMLARGANVDSRVPAIGGRPALYFAVSSGQLDLARLLLEAGASITAGPNRDYPLHVAIDTGNVEMVRLLLDHGADPNWRVRVRGQGRVSPRERAGWFGANDIDELLASYGGRR